MPRSLLWPDPRVKPPFGSVEIDPGHSSTVGLFDLFLFNEGGGNPIDLTSGRQATRTGAPIWVPTGSRHRLGGGVTGGAAFNPIMHGNMVAGDFTTQIIIRPTTWPGAYTVIFEKGTVAVGREHSIFGNTSGQVQYMEVGGGAIDGLARGSMPAGVVSDLIARRTGTTMQLYVNGVSAGSTFTLAGVTERNGVFSMGGNPIGGGSNFNGAYLLFRHWLRALTDGEIVMATAEPYAFLRPIIRRRYFVPAAGEPAGRYAWRSRQANTLLGAGRAG